MSQRLVVAKMLTEKRFILNCKRKTGIYRSNQSHVKRALFDNDTYGYILYSIKIAKGKKPMSYNIFADYYDVLMQNVGYKERSDYICERKSERHNCLIWHYTDLACGYGQSYYGVGANMHRCLRNWPGEMFSEGNAKVSEKGLNILYLKQKMQNLTFTAL